MAANTIPHDADAEPQDISYYINENIRIFTFSIFSGSLFF